ncbi:ShlB/FhaC/HecB family hemolysin secretion/activation protein [Novosphingobium colocasiae]|uniref:Haemolysin activator HlyB C-terminal domain-containing protein n=1 Tax=Novosphingobium colocasiae TaxID=1256513 RepID=A0A918PKY9_9SPHN|nr:ShlB/FhaC/HecB family hemolysin secretion/activation protein [Novosphingobium colocasiae]GGZ14079.1 hypothetical protein GCM10011614_31400 [Novosphingobium colocasiae]
MSATPSAMTGRTGAPVLRGLWTKAATVLLLGGCAASATLIGATPALAQTAPAPLPQTREELDQSRLAAPAPSRAARVRIEGNFDRGPCPLADPAFAQTRVTFAQVEFAGPAGLDLSFLADTWRDKAGQDLPVAALCEVRDRAATALNAAGYLAAVQIPPQRIEKNGTVRIDVMIAKLVEVQVRGDAGPAERTIADHLARLTGQPFFNTRVAERQLLLLGDMPGTQVRLTLKPVAGRPGEVVGDLLVERQPIELAAGIQNLASKATGREGAFVQLALNEMTGLADRTTISGYSTLDFNEQWVLQAAHEMGLGGSGLRIGASVLWGKSDPAGAGPFHTETLAGDLHLSYPLVRRRALSAAAQIGLELVDQDVDFGNLALSRDKLRVLYARLSVDTVDAGSLTGRGGYSLAEPRWRLGGLVELRKGLSALGASDDCSPITDCTAPHVPISDLAADPAAFVVRAQANAEYRPTPGITLAAAPRIQYATDALLSYEGFSVGNYTVGRGYDPGALLGDSGVGSSFEVRVGKLSQGGQTFQFQPFAFFDAAWVWNRDDGSGGPQSLFSAGGGLRARWEDRIDASLMLAAPLKRAPLQPERGDLRILFTVKARLLPWDPS